MDKLRKIIEHYREYGDESVLESFKCKHNGKTGYDNAFDANY